MKGMSERQRKREKEREYAEVQGQVEHIIGLMDRFRDRPRTQDTKFDKLRMFIEVYPEGRVRP